MKILTGSKLVLNDVRMRRKFRLHQQSVNPPTHRKCFFPLKTVTLWLTFSPNEICSTPMCKLWLRCLRSILIVRLAASASLKRRSEAAFPGSILTDVHNLTQQSPATSNNLTGNPYSLALHLPCLMHERNAFYSFSSLMPGRARLVCGNFCSLAF